MQAKAKDQQGGLLRISEIYESVQGEGLLTGTPSIFVRTSGCNLRCWFCDTPFASWRPEGDYWTVAEILNKVAEHSAQHVVLTGGEPMIYDRVVELSQAIRAAGYHLTVETAGTVWHEMDVDLWSISTKLSGSAPRSQPGTWRENHHRRRHRPELVRRFMQQPYQLKFVVDQPTDAQEVLDYLQSLGDFDRQRVLLMPQGIDAQALELQAQWLIPWCQQHDLRYCSRAHIHWFGNRRGT